MATHVSDTISKIKFKPDRLNLQGAACKFFADLTTELRLNRVDHAIENASKAVIVQLLPKLEPAVVRDTVSSAMEYCPKEKKWDFHHFMSKDVEASIEYAKYIPKRSRDPPSGPSGHQDRSKKKTKHGSGQSNHVDKHDKKKEVLASQPGREKKNNRKNATWTDPFLLPKCNKFYAVKDCPDTSEEDKKVFPQQHYENKKRSSLASLVHYHATGAGHA